MSNVSGIIKSIHDILRIDVGFDCDAQIIDRTFVVYRMHFQLSVFLLLVFSTISPLFEGLTLMDQIIVSPVKENLNLKGQGSFDGFTNFNSNRFKFRAFNSLSGDRFVLLPNFEVVKEGSSKKIKPYLWLYDHKTKQDAYIKIEERFSLLSLLEKGKLGNPLFKKQYPELHAALESNKEKYLKRKFQKVVDTLGCMAYKRMKQHTQT